LRQDVNRLEQEADAQPTNAANMVQRALILCDWVNAYSLAGGPVPVAATQEIGAVFQLKEEGSGRAMLNPAVVDRLLYEFRVQGRAPPRSAHAIAIHVEAGAEFGASPPQVRPSATIPAASFSFPFTELKDGLVVRDSAQGRQADSITLQVLDPNAPGDGELDFADRGPANQGDYYYVRVTQINGAHAWSSPIWVGGESTR
jgi:hypothetical protein